MSDNPLASTPRPRPAEGKPHPMLRHAQLWDHVNQQTPGTLQEHVRQMDYALPILGALAGNPDVTAKDVIKALANSVAEGKRSPGSAVAAIANMPSDPDKLRPWLREKYAENLATTVHAKAALMGQAAQQQQQAQQPPQSVPQAPQALPVPMSGQGVQTP